MNEYRMTISRLTIDKLGVKLYDKVSAVIAELVANSYDADAEEVAVKAPMGVYLAQRTGEVVTDRGYEIIVQDNGTGMTPDVINEFYLRVGGERRKDPRRGRGKSPKFGRSVMGRKGIGKLAPFGICNTIEVISSGGNLVNDVDADGEPVEGYRTAHFIMEKDKMLFDSDEEYQPDLGNLDGSLQPEVGTCIKMRGFARRMVPQMATFNRQLSQRFGVTSTDWQIKLINVNSDSDSGSQISTVGYFDVPTMSGTRIDFTGPTSEAVELTRMAEFEVVGHQDNDLDPPRSVQAGFKFADGKFYPILGWVGYARKPYSDELMAGIRIYCRGKIASQTGIFGQKSGFTGEYSIRSYLIGELHADWLDDGEDLIHTDRRDILWSDPLGQEFKEWGQNIVKLIGRRSREPLRKKIWERFLEVGDINRRIEEAFPNADLTSIRDRTLGVARLIGTRLREEEIRDSQYVNNLVQLCLSLGPHIELAESLRDAAGEEETSMGVIATILKTARVAELSSYGLIAERRVKVIEKIQEILDQVDPKEPELQAVLTEAPWLINPMWSPITANQSLSTLRNRFEEYFKKHTGTTISLGVFSETLKRPDFVLSSNDFGLQIIEIKKPNKKLANEEWDRIQRYIDQMEAFLEDSANEDFKNAFKRFTVTIVCDGDNLSGSQSAALKHYRENKLVEWISWHSFLLRTHLMHQEFLTEAKRQGKIKVQVEP